ncbi:MAG: AzlC family ABC transporter permease, partial [Acidobacteriota bacterium]
MEGRLSARPRLDGLLTGLPLVPGIASVGVLYGAASVDAGIPPWTVVTTTLLVATGTAQWVALDLLSRDVAWWTIVLVGLAINLRFAVYSLHIGPWVSRWPAWRRLAYCSLLTDEGYALSMARRADADIDRRSFLRWSTSLAAVVWGAWLVGTGCGALT